jgi:hypothetical protein
MAGCNVQERADGAWALDRGIDWSTSIVSLVPVDTVP